MLSGKKALVTGAGRGIGKGCAIELARAGADLILNDRPGSLDADVTAEEIRRLGRECTVILSDVFSRQGCEQLMEQATDVSGRFDILVSNPAFSRRAPFLDYDAETFEKVIQGALIGGFHISQLAARHFVEQKIAGKIVFISSVHAVMPYAESVAYNAAKGGLNHMMRTIATEMMQHRINVNAIEPGWIDTPGEHETFSEEMIKQEGLKLPWGRLGTTAEIGKAVTYLVSKAADYVTGTTIRVDGGYVLKDCATQF